MDFFRQQERSRRTGRWLVLLFILAVAGTVVAVDAVAYLAGVMFARSWPPAFFAILATPVVLIVIGLATAWRMQSLGAGGAVVATDLGGTLVPAGASDPALRRLRNVVEELALAAGMPVPQLFVMENEKAINAFAAGYGPDDAAICVTRGCLDHLTRDELQGVLGHEFSHILNGDMRLNIRLIGLLFGILVLSVIGREAMALGGGGRDRDNAGRVIGLVGLGMWLVGSVGFFFARLIQAGVGRSRESLADASAVQFTRQTQGIAGALKKIAAYPAGSSLGTARRTEVAHMLFGEAKASAWFATHPPIMQRIQALEPGFSEADLKPLSAEMAKQFEAEQAELLQAARVRLGLAEATPAAASTTRTFAPADALAVAARVGAPQPRDVDQATVLRANLPPALVEAAHDAARACSLVLAVLMTATTDSDASHWQLASLRMKLGDEDAARVQALGVLAASLAPAQRLPLVDLAVPTLRQMYAGGSDMLLKLLRELSMADRHLDLFDYALMRLLRARLVNAADPRAAARLGERKLHDARNGYARLCAVVARFGTDDPAAAKAAWQRAMQEAFGESAGDMPDVRDWRMAFDGALGELERCNPASRELVVRGLWLAIAADGVVTVAEAECLRAICATLGCPLPPDFRDT